MVDQILEEHHIKDPRKEFGDNKCDYFIMKYEKDHGILVATYKEGYVEGFPMNSKVVLARSIEYYNKRNDIEKVGWFRLKDIKLSETV